MQKKQPRAPAIREELRLTSEEKRTLLYYIGLNGRLDSRYGELSEFEQRLVRSTIEALRRGELGGDWAYLRLLRYFPEQVKQNE